MQKIVGSSYLKYDEEKEEWSFVVRAKTVFISHIVNAFAPKNNENVELKIEVKKHGVPKTLPQLGYYFGALMNTLVILYRDAGYEKANHESMDALMRMKYFSDTFIDLSTGEEVRYPKTFKDITKEELSAIIEDICEFEFRENFDVEPPNPKEYKKKKK